MQLVPGRKCGECSVCCVLLNVDTPEFRKMPRIPCQHLGAAGHGCTIHDAAFPICGAYHCGWRYLDDLDEAWRPDKSGVLVEFHNDGFPAHYPKRPGLRLTFVESADTAFQPRFAAFLIAMVKQDIPVMLSLPAPPGYFPAATFVNDALREPVANKDSARIVAVLRNILHSLQGFAFERVTYKHGPAP